MGTSITWKKEILALIKNETTMLLTHHQLIQQLYNEMNIS